MRIRNFLLAALVALSTFNVSMVASATNATEGTENTTNSEVAVEDTEISESVEVDEPTNIDNKTDKIEIYGNLTVLRAMSVYYLSNLETQGYDYEDITFVIKDKETGEVYDEGNIHERLNTRFTTQTAIAFNMYVPEWVEGSCYELTFNNLPVYYADAMLSTKTENENNKNETTQNADGTYSVTTDLSYYYYTYDYTDLSTGETTTVEMELGKTVPLSFSYTYNKKGDRHTYYSVVDKNGELVSNAEIVMQTDKGEYRANTGTTGIGHLTGYSRGETIKKWTIYYNNMVLAEINCDLNLRLGVESLWYGLKVNTVDNSALQAKSNWLVATVSNPEKVDFSLIGDNGKLGIVLDIRNEANEIVQKEINSTGEVVLLDGVYEGKYTISVANSNGFEFEIDKNIVEVKGKTGITLRLKAKKVLGITNKVDGKETAFNYCFNDDSRLSGLNLSSEFTKYYAVPNEGVYTIANTDTKNEYTVNFTAVDKNRVKVLNLADGTITESDSVVVNDNIFNPDTADELTGYIVLGLSAILLGLYVMTRKEKR